MHCFFWAWHHVALAFLFCAIGGIAIGAFLLPVPRARPALASSAENVRGWVWADPVGWISLNDMNPSSGGGTYGVNVDISTGEINGFGWSELSGWVCFGSSCSVAACAGTVPNSNVPYNVPYADIVTDMSGSNAHGWAKVCNEGDAGWISLNCGDLNPSACGAYNYHVPFDTTTHQFEDTSGGGSPANGTSFAWNGNSDDTGIGYVDFRQAYLQTTPENTAALCANSVDDDVNGAVDCADPSCAAYCAPPPDLLEKDCPLGVDKCCSNNLDDNGDGKIDCDDASCQGNASMCTVAWLKTQFGNVYAQKGIASIAAPADQFNASYCLSLSDGSITGFASQAGCTSMSSALTLPSGGTNYKGSLGNIDIVGIQNGRYGTVVPIANGDALPQNLDGKVYVYSGGGVLNLPTKMFQNGTGSSGRGNGLLLVQGNLYISGDLSYASPSVNSYLRNLASLGIIVVKGVEVGGNITIDPSVTTAVGAMFAESSISTGASNTPLTVYGLLAARLLNFERTGGTSSTAAETVTFDGRAVANPPPGMQDVGKSLPTIKEAF